MGIAGMNIYAATIIVYIIAGIANADKRGLNLQRDDSRAGKPCPETVDGRSRDVPRQGEK